MDFLSRRPVRATMMIAIDKDERGVAERLPEFFLLANGVYRFSAGVWESYFVNGKEYNVDGNRSLAEQRQLILQDLSAEGFE